VSGTASGSPVALLTVMVVASRRGFAKNKEAGNLDFGLEKSLLRESGIELNLFLSARSRGRTGQPRAKVFGCRGFLAPQGEFGWVPCPG
jgi:hypothetical protein